MMPSTSRLLSGPGGQGRARELAPSQRRAGVDDVHQRRRPRVHRLEDQEHHHAERDQPEHRMQQPAIERVVDLRGAARHRHRERQQAARFGVQRFRIDVAPAGRHRRAARWPTSNRASPPAPARRCDARRSSARPARRVSRSSLARSTSMPRRLAASIMLTASTIGRPSARTSSAKRRCRRRLVASTTQTMTSGAGSPG